MNRLLKLKPGEKFNAVFQKKVTFMQQAKTNNDQA